MIYIRDSKSRGYLRIGVSFDGEKKEYTLSESEYRGLGSPLIGDEISDTQELLACDMRYKAKLYALRILSYADNNVSSLKRKLISSSIPAEIAEQVCEQMVGLGYVNETRQLEKLIENEANVKLYGKRKIFQRLLAKGYAKKEIESVLSNLISHGIVDFEKTKEILINKRFPDGATRDEIRALLFKSGHSSDFDFDGNT